jgi:oxygen-independent coproporphyrinogen-3 oxidase
MIGIYVHIPFCRTLCPYCDFVKRPLDAGPVPSEFIDALCGEIAAFDGPSEADSVFIGGGTPSLMEPADLARVLNAFGGRFQLHEAEISIEANPDDVTADLAQAWKRAGVNRVSLGVQSFNDRVLAYLGRRHGADGARAACGAVAAAFTNWSLDLMFGAQPIDAWPATLDECARIAPPHFSAYGLTFEPRTPFGERADEAVDDETFLELCNAIGERLPDYRRYEISNYAKPGFECRHNLHYWRNEEYAGFGPGAYSYVNGVRARNDANLDRYLAEPGVKREALQLSETEQRVETIIQYMRLDTGLPKSDYAGRFGAAPETHFGEQINALIDRGLIEAAHDALRPTSKGFDLNNEIGLMLVDASATSPPVNH